MFSHRIEMQNESCGRPDVEQEGLESQADIGKKKRTGWVFAGIFLAVCLLTGLFLVLWAWISYHMRFSAEVIRAGLMAGYILPCFIGGKLFGRLHCEKAALLGAGLGGLFFLLVLLLAAETSVHWPILLLCVGSGALGGIRRR